MEKQRWEESEKRREEERRSEKRRNQKEDAAARKGRKVAKHCVFPMICGSAEPSGQMRDEKLHAVVARSTFRSQNVQSTVERWSKCTPLWCEADFEVKMFRQNMLALVALFGLEVEKCTALWREAHFESAKKTSLLARFWKLIRCSKSAHRCSLKHMWK